MAESVLRGMAGESGVYEAAYVASSVTELPYFASKARRPASEHSITLFFHCINQNPTLHSLSHCVQRAGPTSSPRRAALHLSFDDSRLSDTTFNSLTRRIQRDLASQGAPPCSCASAAAFARFYTYIWSLNGMVELPYLASGFSTFKPWVAKRFHREVTGYHNNTFVRINNRGAWPEDCC